MKEIETILWRVLSFTKCPEINGLVLNMISADVEKALRLIETMKSGEAGTHEIAKF
jgi:hypothetical protein